MNGTNNVEIEAICKKLGLLINPVVTKDMLSKRNCGWTIFNTENYKDDFIGHFCCFYKGNENLYFDSFGFIPCLAVEDILNSDYEYNHREIQDYYAKSCGMFCIALVKYCSHNGNTYQSLKRFCGMFSDNTKVNDSILIKMFL